LRSLFLSFLDVCLSVLTGEAVANEHAAHAALAKALEQLGAVSVQKGRVDALYTSSWNHGFFSESDRLMLFDYEGAICSLEMLPGGVPALVPGPRAAAAGALKEDEAVGVSLASPAVADAPPPKTPGEGNRVLEAPLPLADIAAFGLRFPARPANAEGPQGLARRQLVAIHRDGSSVVLLEEAVVPLSQLQAGGGRGRLREMKRAPRGDHDR
jgi:hypothetical protein